MAVLYDRADIYDLLEDENRYQGTKKHWERMLSGKEIHTLLDVSIGSGNLTLPLLELGIRLSGSDLSEAMLDRCRKKANARGEKVDLRVSDFRELTQAFCEQFDCVASTGNSLGYVENHEVLGVLEQMNTLVAPGGYLYFDLRNWDKILRTRQRFYLYNPAFVKDTRINLVQVWDYCPDGSMDFNLLYTFEQNNRIVQKEAFCEHYHPVPQKLVLDKLKDMGYRDVEIYGFPAQLGAFDDNVDWYCVMAKKQPK